MTEPADHPPPLPGLARRLGPPCLVVGGGPVAARKARGLLDCGASVTVIAPSLGDDMEALVPSLHAVERRPYGEGDASTYRLVVTATGIPEVDGAVYADAEAAGVWVNSADDLAHCSFILPAVHRDGAVTVSVSTGGLSPALASWLRTRWPRSAGTGSGPWPSCSARPGRTSSGRGCAATRWTGRACSTALFWSSSVRATSTTPGQWCWPRPVCDELLTPCTQALTPADARLLQRGPPHRSGDDPVPSDRVSWTRQHRCHVADNDEPIVDAAASPT